MANKYFLYVRKSQESEERQILSIEAQITELHLFAEKEKLQIVQEFIEAMTAKVPGRPKFNEMLNRMEKGEAQGIIAWHPDRLARNSVDGGRIIYCLDTGKIQTLKFPTFWFENTPQGKFMMNIAFGQSKYWIDNLSENVKRGNRQKLRNGGWPHQSPLGYWNDKQNRRIAVDPQRGPAIKKLFEEYATGKYNFKTLGAVAASWGLVSRHTNNPLFPSNVQDILTNTFYYGLMKYNGEFHQGKHEPIITKELYDKVQEVMRDRGKPQEVRKHLFPFVQFIQCKHCGGFITAEVQKGYHYYHCTKKKGPCPEKGFTREEVLDQQITKAIADVSLPREGYEEMLAHLHKDQQDSSQMLQQEQAKIGKPLQEVQSKLDKLLDLHLNGHVSQEEYVSRKEKFLNEKIALEERLSKIKNHGNIWLEPFKEFLEAAHQADQVATDKNLAAKREFLKKIGSNFRLASKTLEFSYTFPWVFLKKSQPISKWCARQESNLQPKA